MTIIKSLKVKFEYPHRIHRSKKRTKYKGFNKFDSLSQREKINELLEKETKQDLNI